MRNMMKKAAAGSAVILMTCALPFASLAAYSDFGPAYAAEEAEESETYLSLKHAYENQTFTELADLPTLPTVRFYVSDSYKSVTLENLQGSWVNKYREGGHDYVEVLSVNGDRGRIQTWQDGVIYGVWNDEGSVSIEDRTARGVCPAFRINDDETGRNICTIYIRWVKDQAFYDGGFTCEWKRMDPDQFDFLTDTITMENLQGLWYSEFYDDGGFYQDVLDIEGNQATLFEMIDRVPSKIWNKKGAAWLEEDDYGPGKKYQMLCVRDDVNGTGVAGIYISYVNKDSFFDPGFMRYWYRVPKNLGPYWSEDWGEEENQLEAIGDPVILEKTNHILLFPTGKNAESNPDAVSRWYIELINEEKAAIAIDHEIDPMTIYFPEADDLVREEDVNFDGRMDVLIYRGTLGAHGVRSEDCYLNFGDHWERCEDFEFVGDACADPGKKVIVSTMRDSAMAYYYLEYAIEGNKVVEKKSIHFVYDEEAQDYLPEED